MEKVVLELAGRDSVAAAFSFLKGTLPQEVYPTIARAPVEYGGENPTYPLQLVEERWKDKTKIHPLIKLQNPPLWSALNGRFVSTIIEKYGFFTPCLGCHLYFHLLRIPVAQKFNVKTVISGEREMHDEKTKINQISEALEAYREVLLSVQIKLEFPLRKVESGEEVEKIIGFSWLGEENQPRCVFSKNYWVKGTPKVPAKINSFIEEFLIPAGKELARAISEGRNNYFEIVKNHLE